MTNYDVTVKKFLNDEDGTAEENLKAYLNALADTKTIRAVSASSICADNVVIILVHDA